MWKRIKHWYEGEYISSQPSDAVIFLNHYRRHWSSRLVHTIVDFYSAEWRWLLPFLVACVVAAATIWKLR
jgi:hypothetical protein